MQANQLLAVLIGVLVVFVLATMAKAIRIIQVGRVGVVERLGQYSRTIQPGVSVIVPYLDKVRRVVDLSEQTISFTTPIVTQDHIVVTVDAVVHYQVVDPQAATYEIANEGYGVETLAITTLRKAIGDMELDDVLVSRGEISVTLRQIMDEAAATWGLRVNLAEVKAIVRGNQVVT
jgi:regulator of protease activity HflC (stomatin/prohibitin superfamily)